MKEFTMTDEQLKKLLNACESVPYIAVTSPEQAENFRGPQQNANDAWDRLGEEMGFKGSTVKPCGKGTKTFMAEPV